MVGSIGKLSRGSLSHNKSYKPDGRKAYARAALKCAYKKRENRPRTSSRSVLP
jgi:hypothetical protein